MKAGFRVALWGALVLIPGAFASELAGLVDPTRPQLGAGEVEAALPSGPVLQSTIVSQGRRRAIISGRVYEVGDRVGGAVIAAIESHEVVLQQGGRETRLRLYPPLHKPIFNANKDH